MLSEETYSDRRHTLIVFFSATIGTTSVQVRIVPHWCTPKVLRVMVLGRSKGIDKYLRKERAKASERPIW